MPAMWTIEPNPDYALPQGASAAEKAAWDAVKKGGSITVAAVTAKQNVRASGGMYRVAPAPGPAPAASPLRSLQEMSNEELKLMMLTAGVKTDKQMKRGEIIKAIEVAMEKVEILPDD